MLIYCYYTVGPVENEKEENTYENCKISRC